MPANLINCTSLVIAAERDDFACFPVFVNGVECGAVCPERDDRWMANFNDGVTYADRHGFGSRLAAAEWIAKVREALA